MLTKMMSWLKRARSEKGFTLIELVVVIGIMGILAGIAVPRFSNYRATAEKRADQLTVRLVRTAMELYEADGKTLPDGTTLDTLWDALVPEYLDPAPTFNAGTATYNNGEFAYTPNS